MKIIRWSFKCIVSLILAVILAVVATSVSLVYDFAEPKPFSGEEIFNPYLNFNKNIGWSRANFHTHTRVEGPLNECEYTPEQTLEFYDRFNYEIVTLSNHNEITPHPTSDTRVYEHGYNIAKFHKLVFGAEKEWRFDNLLPIFTFQKQFQIDRLSKQGDIVVINHPLRTHTMTNSQLTKIGGYDIIELDSGKSTENSYWDAALSAGRYCFGIANDDLHYPTRSHCIAVRSNMLCTDSADYSSIRDVLLSGCFYAMRTPDYGGGEWEVKAERNKSIPHIKNIGVEGDKIFIALSEAADSIKVTGQNHTTLAVIENTDSLGYAMLPTESYGRFTAYFADGEVIYSNPFARYDAAEAQSPFEIGYNVNLTLTILFNLLLLALFLAVAMALYKVIRLW
jgi:hypothetical protein